jgi:predicted MPP superfamily phosphohydrolase
VPGAPGLLYLAAMSTTEELAAGLAERQPLRERARLAFFRSFFSLLLLFLGFAEWACVAWVLHLLGVAVPAVANLAAPLAILSFNRWVLVRRARPRPLATRLIRGYAAFAFTCVFCALFLAASVILWGVLRLATAPVGTLVAGVAAAPIAQAYFWAVDAGMATVAGLMLYGFTLGKRQLVVSQVRVPIPGLAPSFDGLRIVHLSDLHIGQYLDLEELADHVRRVNALEPDLVCLTGDLVDRGETCALAFPTLAGLRARHGVFVTLGNHDFYAGAERVTAALRRLTPFTVLRDARAEIRVGAAALTVLGIDDLGRDWARGALEHPALPPLTAAAPAGAPVLLLSHRPDCFAQAARLGVSLMLSGHTHGGQLALPPWLAGRLRNLAEFITDFDRGEFRRGGSTLYVNRGLGFTGQKIRLFTPREIACIELRAC